MDSLRSLTAIVLFLAMAGAAPAQEGTGPGKCPPYDEPGKTYDASPIVDAIDINGDDKMTHEEWVAAEAPEPSWNMFMDKEKVKAQGYITREDFITETPPNGIDTDCDGLITLDEFLATKKWKMGGGPPPGSAAEKRPTVSTGDSAKDFIKLYPGVYTEREKSLVEKYISDNKALEERGEIDIQALINGTLSKDTPGIGPVIKVTEEMVRYNNEKYDPDNPVFNNAEYAKRLGYKDILAYPTFGGHDDTFMKPYPPPVRDKLLVSDLNHNFTNYRPVYPGDTLYLVINSRHITDLTPATGSIYRSIAIQSKGSIYNQRGEKVTDVIFRVTESMRIYKEGKGPKKPGFSDMWEAPDWMSRPAHYYTDKDWEYIKGIWSREKRQGAAPLYWEDVKIGDEPAWTLDGPIEESVSPVPPWGMGIGGSRTMKKEIMDPEILGTMIRGKNDGIYRLPNKEDYIPPVPGIDPMDKGPMGDAAIDTTDIHKKAETRRAVLINYMGRDFAIRHINNWMGDHGWLYNVRWSIMDPRAHALYGKNVPVNPQAEHFLSRVPKMKGRHVNAHGLTGDVAIIKSYVYDKYVRDGDFLVELVWWVETIEGDIWEEGGATVRLPSKRLKKK